jgi:hypothetical protein
MGFAVVLAKGEKGKRLKGEKVKRGKGKSKDMKFLGPLAYP